MIQYLGGDVFHSEPDRLYYRCTAGLREGGKGDDRPQSLKDPALQKKAALQSAIAALAESIDQPISYWSNRSQLFSAYQQLILAGADKEQEDPQLVLHYFLICTALERYRDAHEAFQRLTVLGDEECLDTARGFEIHFPNKKSVPLFMNNFITRCRNTWRALAKGTSDVWKMRKTRRHQDSQARRAAELCSALYPIFGLNVVSLVPAQGDSRKGSSGKKLSLCFLSPDYFLDYFPIQFALDLMANSLKDKWEPCIGLPPLQSTALSLAAAAGGNLESLRICVSDSPQHKGADVQLYEKNLQELYQQKPVLGQRLADLWVRLILGDLTACVSLNSVSISDTSFHACTSHSLLQLPQLLEEMGYPSQAAPADLERKLHRTYARFPTAPGKLLRADIISGWTDCWTLQDEYSRGKEDAFFHFMDQGICAAFVAWPKSIMDCPESEFVRRITDSIDRTTCSYHVIGQATGTVYSYLDMMIWSASPLIRALEDFFLDIPRGNCARIQGFCHSGKPSPINFYAISEGTVEWKA